MSEQIDSIQDQLATARTDFNTTLALIETLNQQEEATNQEGGAKLKAKVFEIYKWLEGEKEKYPKEEHASLE